MRPNQALNPTRQPAGARRRFLPFPRGASVEMSYNGSAVTLACSARVSAKSVGQNETILGNKMISRKCSILVALLDVIFLIGCANMIIDNTTNGTLSPIANKLETKSISPIIRSTNIFTATKIESATPTYWIFEGYRTKTNYRFEFEMTRPKATITAPPPRVPEIKLPNGLFIEEYNRNASSYPGYKEILLRHPEKGNWYYWPKAWVVDEKYFIAREYFEDGKIVAVVEYDNRILFTKKCESYPIEIIRTFWVYDSHWMMQIICDGNYDVIIDGESQNLEMDYESSFGAQLMNGVPFLLFKRNAKVWLRYKEEETLLNYDSVELFDSYDAFPPQHYENMIDFHAEIGNEQYEVIIGYR